MVKRIRNSFFVFWIFNLNFNRSECICYKLFDAVDFFKKISRKPASRTVSSFRSMTVDDFLNGFCLCQVSFTIDECAECKFSPLCLPESAFQKQIMNCKNNAWSAMTTDFNHVFASKTFWCLVNADHYFINFCFAVYNPSVNKCIS